MTGETELRALLAGLVITPRPGRWVFGTSVQPPGLDDVAMAFREDEGWSVIRPARPGDTAPVFAWLEVSVHSSLEAVGFLAALSAALAGAAIPCNAVAGYFHDHIFVPETQRDRAIAALEALVPSS